MEDYDVSSEMYNVKSKKVVMLFEDDEKFISNILLNKNIELLPFRVSYNLDKFTSDYIQKTSQLFNYYFDKNNSYQNELIKLKKHFVHYQRFPFIAYIPQNIENYEVIFKMLTELKIEVIDDKQLFLEKVMNDSKLVFLDNDGTLCRSDGSVSKETKLIISEIKKKGNYVVVATSRPRYQTKKIVEEIGASSIMISSNGSEIYDLNNNKIINSVYINNDVCFDLIKEAYRNDLRLILTLDDVEYVTKEKRNSNQLLLDCKNYQCQLEDKKIKQCMFIDVKEDIINIIKKKVIANKDIKVIDEINKNDTYQEKWFSIGISTASKGQALKMVADYLKIPIKNTIAIGNDYNDISMLEMAGYSIAVANADENIKKMVEYVTLSNDDDGVAKVLNEMFS